MQKSARTKKFLSVDEMTQSTRPTVAAKRMQLDVVGVAGVAALKIRTGRAHQLVGLSILEAIRMVHNVRYLNVSAQPRNAFDVIGPPGRKAAGCTYYCKHVVCPNLRNRSGEPFEVSHDVVALHLVAHNVRCAAGSVYALQACLLIDAKPHDNLAARAI